MVTQDFIRNTLINEVVKVSFVKQNGEARDMVCTLREDIIPEEHKPASGKSPKVQGLVSVWDLEKKGWRSFKVDSINTFEVTKKYG